MRLELFEGGLDLMIDQICTWYETFVERAGKQLNPSSEIGGSALYTGGYKGRGGSGRGANSRGKSKPDFRGDAGIAINRAIQLNTAGRLLQPTQSTLFLRNSRHYSHENRWISGYRCFKPGEWRPTVSLGDGSPENIIGGDKAADIEFWPPSYGPLKVPIGTRLDALEVRPPQDAPRLENLATSDKGPDIAD
eukprot:CAMPEP_0196663798 /NCGR_PEP_ID=MMETSP1086-20130531/54315_1 /TAXON_ID=77921 /ORGANISM="Cyanoptyche  gloeocystis , Strain SAG4.97" /LENGTH=191 /DNA_ID=CAMNT_0041999765 /DNA_START=99 /DNA_END=674 /DNA_ORIENTATION=+